jgi:hypothetical protein
MRFKQIASSVLRAKASKTSSYSGSRRPSGVDLVYGGGAPANASMFDRSSS